MTRKHTVKNRYVHGLKGGAIVLFGVAVVSGAIVYLATELYPGTLEASGIASIKPARMVLDKVAYDAKMLAVANVGTTTASTSVSHWPVQAAYPNAGAILPFKRVVAYYGNFYSKQMGILGEYESEEVLRRLRAAAAEWEAADPATPVVPAIDYIAVTAQASAGADGMYRLRMPDSQIDKALEMVRAVDGIVILDVQIGFSTLRSELSALEKYLSMPQVHLAIDPEFSMKHGIRPGKEIGIMDAADINYAAEYLATLVREHNLPPKILVVHRFTEEMVTGYRLIKPLPEVQVVIDMDGWGFPEKKLNTYRVVVQEEPVQFAGFKIFYKNDMRSPSTRLLSPRELLRLSPQPVFIQYQ